MHEYAVHIPSLVLSFAIGDLRAMVHVHVPLEILSGWKVGHRGREHN